MIYQYMHTLLFQFEASLGEYQQQIGRTGAGGICKAAHYLGDVTQKANQQILPNPLHTQSALVLGFDVEGPIGAQKYH